MIELVEQLRRVGAVTSLDHRFAQLLARRGGVTDPRVLAACALAGSVGETGHVCLSLPDAARVLTRELAARHEGADDPPALPSLPDVGDWEAALRAASAIVRTPGEDRVTPLVLDGSALYLDRAWTHQRALQASILGRLGANRSDVDRAALEQVLDRLFHDDPEREADQRRAVATAISRRLAVVVGGPGTGKTAVVVRLLAALASLERRAGRDAPRVVLVAPTGKAAARMSESIRDRLDAWIPSDLRDAIDPEASTIHRALGIHPATGRPRHHADNPLLADLVVVDEASMVDLPLMAKLLAAVPPEARLVLLGDPDQLVSVEKGAVLRDLAAGTTLGDHLVILRRTFRFSGGIARLAAAINAGDADAALAALAEEEALELLDVAAGAGSRGLADRLRSRVVRGYRSALVEPDPAKALRELRRFRVLCAHRRGARGVEVLGPRLEGWLRSGGLLPKGKGPWYRGRPVLVTHNDHQRSLYNGDVGLLLSDPGDPDGPLRAWFEGGTDGVRAFAPAGLPPHDTVFATTVHKSQGSEYDEVVVVLPARPSPLLTRELLYTAVTRACERVVILGSEDRIREAVERRTERMSGGG